MSSAPPLPGRERPLASLVLRAFQWIGAGLAVGFALNVGRVVAHFYVLSPRVVRYETASRALTALHAGMLDQETGLRGYLFTGVPGFLEPAERGSAATAREMDTLVETLGAEPGWLRSVLALRLAVDTWQRQWAEPAKRRAVAPGAEDLLLADGKRLFDAYRATESDLAGALVSQRDALTRLWNRRRLDEELAAECKRSARYQRPLAVAMLDVDHFKKINDAFGHAEGDAVLQHVADVLARTARGTDAVFRYGGEEFLILMRETTSADAAVSAERVRRAVESECGDPSRRLVVTVSIGVAELDRANPLPRTLVEAADRALYEAKREGRNRVVGGAIRA